MITDRAILIPSCDKYSDLWDSFFLQFWKYWPDCPYIVYLGSNNIKYKKDQRVKNLTTGKDLGWAPCFKKFLKQIPEKYLFIWPEDAFIISKVDGNGFKECFNFLFTNRANHIHYRCLPKPKFYTEDNLLGVYEKGMPNIVNMAGFWDKSYLSKLILYGENSWDFEVMGSYRASFDEGFFCLAKPLFSFIHLSEKGKWNKEAIDYSLKHNIKINLSSRKVLATNNYYLKKLQDIYYNFVLNKNWRLRVKLMNFFRKLLISY